MKTSKRYLEKLAAILGSDRFFIFIIIFFVLEAIWIAFSAVYPQAFDEDFHYGLIKVYSNYWLPFLTSQPPHAAALGAVTRDPSYLYHYLMSFPYRILALFVHSQPAQVIALRLFNAGLFTAGIVLFRKVFLRVGLSKALSHTCLFLFVLIPVVPLLASQINYDNLLFLLTGWLILQTFGIIDQIKERQVSARRWLVLITVSIFAALVKYAFLPILAGIFIFLAYLIFKSYRHNLKKFWRQFVQDFGRQSKWSRAGLVLVVLIALGMFGQRDGYNLVRYHAVVPDCSKVLNVKECSTYSAWYVDYQRHQQVVSGATPASENIVHYTKDWLYWMWYRLFFAVNGPASNFASSPPLFLPGIAAIILAAIGLVALLKRGRSILRANPYLAFMFTISIIYLAALFVKGFATYKHTAVLENMNGRYLVPVLLPMAAILGLALSISLGRAKAQKSLAAAVIIVLLLQGGGALTFILRSDDTWDWPDKHVVKVNNTVRKVAKHVVVKANKQ